MGSDGRGTGGTEGHAGTSLGEDGRAIRNCALVMGMRSNSQVDVLVRALLALAILAAPALALLYSVPAGLAVLGIGLFILSHLLSGARAHVEPQALRPITALIWLNVALGAACLAAAVWLLATG